MHRQTKPRRRYYAKLVCRKHQLQMGDTINLRPSVLYCAVHVQSQIPNTGCRNLGMYKCRSRESKRKVTMRSHPPKKGIKEEVVCVCMSVCMYMCACVCMKGAFGTGYKSWKQLRPPIAWQENSKSKPLQPLSLIHTSFNFRWRTLPSCWERHRRRKKRTISLAGRTEQ